MSSYMLAKVPLRGERISYEAGVLKVPDIPIIPYVEGDGTGADIWRAAVRVFDAAVRKAFHGQKKVAWMEGFPAEKPFTAHNDWLPQATVDALPEFPRSIRGPPPT